MKLLVYSAKSFEVPFLKLANGKNHKVTFLSEALNTNMAMKVLGYKAISIFWGDDPSPIVLEKFWNMGVRYITV